MCEAVMIALQDWSRIVSAGDVHARTKRPSSVAYDVHRTRLSKTFGETLLHRARFHFKEAGSLARMIDMIHRTERLDEFAD